MKNEQGNQSFRRVGAAVVAIVLVLVLACGSALAAYPTLKRGSSGEQVRTMQKALIALGYYTGAADGRYGESTEAAVRAFQLDNKLKLDGKAGDQTLTVLYQLSGKGSSSQQPSSDSSSSSGALFRGDYSTMKYGSRGDRVTTLQKALATLGHTPGKIDGFYGTSTQKAVTEFQRKYALTADGKAGKNTLTTIEKAVSGGTIAVPSVPNPSLKSMMPTRTLRRYNKGNDVMSVQYRLSYYGYYTGNIDGVFGSGMQAAVRNFQAAYGLKVDGVCGSAVYAILYSETKVEPSVNPSAPTTPSTPTGSTSTGIPTRSLRKGCEGDDVKSVQQKLKAAGYYTGNIDGKYGTTSVRAVMAFQAANKLKVDGIAGKATYAILFGTQAPSTQTDTQTQTQTETPAANTDITLSVGSSGANVTAMQARLLALKYNVIVNGTFDSITKEAVTAFQKRNSLKVDGIAGPKTLTLLFSDNCVTGDTLLPEAGNPVITTVPSTSEIKLLHWFNDIKINLKNGSILKIVDPTNGYTWNVKVYSRGRHADCEPATQQDTDTMYAAFGNKFGWICKAVYVKLPSGTWTVAATHDMPHLSGNISDNGFDGHLCVHFLRDMSETEQNDPDWGVTNQKAIRELWKSVSGKDIDY